MFELLGTVLTGGATGIVGSVIGKMFGFVDYWVEEKKADKEHGRTIEMLRLQNEIGATRTTLWVVQVVCGSLTCYVLSVLLLLLVSLF